MTWAVAPTLGPTSERVPVIADSKVKVDADLRREREELRLAASVVLLAKASILSVCGCLDNNR
jgi:hypothetical protein